MQLSLRTDRALLRAGSRSTRHLLVSITAPAAAARAERLPVHVGIVLDRSGSMGGGKFELARVAVEQSLRMLNPDDRFTLVVFDTTTDVLAPAVLATAAAKREALLRLAEVEPRGGTDLHSGWMAAATGLAAFLDARAVTRVLLLTDGQANAGIVEPAALAAQAETLRGRGIATSTFGIGEDFDERILRDIAHAGGGNAYYVQTPEQIPALLTSELGEALEIVVRGAAIQVALPLGATAEPLNRLRHVLAVGDNELRIELGDLVSAQELDVAVSLRFAALLPGDTAAVGVRLTDANGIATLAEGTLEWRYASHAENDVQARDRMVDRAVAALYAARARAAATEANRAGDYDEARRVLVRT
ncbi:MAG: VWA domain-containing protein, partial [bacterium]